MCCSYIYCCCSSLQPSLLPLLLLLSRLYPSHLDEANSPTGLAPFIPLLIRCSATPPLPPITHHQQLLMLCGQDLSLVVSDPTRHVCHVCILACLPVVSTLLLSRGNKLSFVILNEFMSTAHTVYKQANYKGGKLLTFAAIV